MQSQRWLGEDLDQLESLQARKRRKTEHDIQEQMADEFALGDGIDSCAICLNKVSNKAWVHPCLHNDFCLDCLSSWTELSRKCPLCNGVIEMLMTHVIPGSCEYQAHYLLPLLEPGQQQAARPVTQQAIRAQLNNRHSHPRHKYPISTRVARNESLSSVDEAALQLQRRRFVYFNKLYVKHVGSNGLSRYKAFTPAQFAASQDLKARAIRFIRRELLAFPHVDTEFLVTYVVSIMSQLDLKSEGAIRLMSEFLGADAEHFAHEVYSFCRSPFDDPRKWDKSAVYDRPHNCVSVLGAFSSPSQINGDNSTTYARSRSNNESSNIQSRNPNHPLDRRRSRRKSNVCTQDNDRSPPVTTINDPHCTEHNRTLNPTSLSHPVSAEEATQAPAVRNDMSNNLREDPQDDPSKEASSEVLLIAKDTEDRDSDVISLGLSRDSTPTATDTLTETQLPNTNQSDNSDQTLKKKPPSKPLFRQEERNRFSALGSLRAHLGLPRTEKNGLQIVGIARRKAEGTNEQSDKRPVPSTTGAVIAQQNIPFQPTGEDQQLLISEITGQDSLPRSPEERRESLLSRLLMERMSAAARVRQSASAAEQFVLSEELRIKLQARLQQEVATVEAAEKRRLLQAKLEAERALPGRRNDVNEKLAAERAEQISSLKEHALRAQILARLEALRAQRKS